MHKLLLSALLLVSVTGYGQIEMRPELKKIEIGSIKTPRAELYGTVVDGDTTYTLMYKNAAYQTLTDFQSVSFSNDENTLGTLYDILKSVFKEENKKNKDYKVQFKLGETEVIVSNYRSMGMTAAMFFTTRGHTFFSEKQVDKLFGKE